MCLFSNAMVRAWTVWISHGPIAIEHERTFFIFNVKRECLYGKISHGAPANSSTFTRTLFFQKRLFIRYQHHTHPFHFKRFVRKFIVVFFCSSPAFLSIVPPLYD